MSSADTCLKNIWANFLYINNYGPAYNFEPVFIFLFIYIHFFLTLIYYFKCLGPSWYLGADMQFYILSPLVLIPLCLSRRTFQIFGLVVAFIFIALNIILAALTTDADYPFQYPIYTIYLGKVYFVAWYIIFEIKNHFFSNFKI